MVAWLDVACGGAPGRNTSHVRMAEAFAKAEFRSHVGKKKDLTSCETKLSSDSKILTDD